MALDRLLLGATNQLLIDYFWRIWLIDLSLPVVDKAVYMVGSYGPRAEEHEFNTPVEEAPKGMIVRGTYHIKSYFTDDDKTDHLSWEWNLQIKKDWDSAE